MPPYYQILLPPEYRKLSHRKRLLLELITGVAILVLISIAVCTQTPPRLQLAGWACLVVYWMVLSVLFVQRRGRRQARGR